jgi:hypothetical protein
MKSALICLKGEEGCGLRDWAISINVDVFGREDGSTGSIGDDFGGLFHLAAEGRMLC